MSSRGDAGEGPGSDSAPSPGRRSSLRMRAKSLFSSAARSLGKVGAKAKEKMQSTKGSIQRSKLSRVVGGHDGTDAKKIPSSEIRQNHMKSCTWFLGDMMGRVSSW